MFHPERAVCCIPSAHDVLPATGRAHGAAEARRLLRSTRRRLRRCWGTAARKAGTFHNFDFYMTIYFNSYFFYYNQCDTQHHPHYLFFLPQL